MDSWIIGIMCVGILLVLIALGIHIAISLLVSGLIGLSIILGFEQAILMSVRSMYGNIVSRTDNFAFIYTDGIFGKCWRNK